MKISLAISAISRYTNHRLEDFAAH